MKVLQAELPSAAGGSKISGPVRRAGMARAWHRARLIQVLPSLVPGLLMAAIGAWHAGRPNLSWDEVATADVAARSSAQIWRLIHTVDAVFGPYYFFMHFWTSIAGTTEVDLRLPSIIAMAGAVALAGELGRRLFTPLIGLLTGLFLCLMPNTSRYAAEARPYAFACLFSVLALLLLYRALERPRMLRWLAYGLALVCLGLSHIIALTTLGAHIAVLVLHQRHTRSWRVVSAWCATVAAALLLLSPIAWLGMSQRHTQLLWVPPLTVRTLWGAPAAIVGSAEVAWLMIGLVLVAAWGSARHLTALALMVLLPMIALAAVSMIGSPMWVPRYLLVVLAPTAMLAAVGAVGSLRQVRARLGKHWGDRVLIARLVAVLAVLTFAAYPGQRSVRAVDAKNGGDYRGAVNIIERYAQPGDGVVYQAGTRALREGIDHYLRHDAGRPRDLLQMRSAASVGSLQAQEYPDPARHVAGVERVWLVGNGYHSDPTTVRPALSLLLRTQYNRVGAWHLHRATLALFSRRD